MREFVTLTLGLILSVCQVHLGVAQRMLSIKPDNPVICYYSLKNYPDHVPVSEKFRWTRQNGMGRAKTAVFEVEYINFPADNLAKNAFQYAIDIWETELTSTIPIRIRAEWRSLDPGVLGQALWGSAFANFGGEQHTNIFYPVALAEKISRRDLNAVTEPDIVASFSSNTSWYLGTDGNTPSGKMDLVTIVLHEIAHGLGFTDTYDVDGTQGSVGLSSGGAFVPFVFDVFVENNLNKNLIHDFQSPSTGLAAALQSNNLFYNTPLSIAALSGTKPKLFAPSTFDNGSSISHLDEATFSTPGDANRLMTPHIASAESIHDPGSVLLGMLNDMGWINTNIDHTPLKDTELKNGQPFPVTTIIRSDNGYDETQVKLHYTTNGIDFTTVSMIPTAVPDQFESSLPGTTSERSYAYFISVVDGANRTFTNPGKLHESGEPPEQGTHFFKIGTDVAGPEIIHEPVEFIFDGNKDLSLTAEVTDNLGVKEVFVEYVVNGGAVQTKIMTKVFGTDEFITTVDLPVLSIGDEIEYGIVARDLAGIENISRLPEEEYFVVAVTGILPVQDSYFNAFNEPTSDFFGNNFSITTPQGFDDGAIHSDHPYSNGTGPNEESNYIYQLQVPIRIGHVNPVIRFDEIVLVEPGAEGSEFGDEDFFDYVVVEGSIDGGVSWQVFAPGYDSRDRDVWLDRYNEDMSNDNSESQGDPDLYRKRTINMLDNNNFSEGDEAMVRFRLFADAVAHGWGWAIDNLSIQPPVTDVEQPHSSSFRIYPVPVIENLFVEFLDPNHEPASIRISDMQGRTVYTEEWASTTIARRAIDVQSLTEGLYILRVENGNAIYTRKFLKVAH